MLSGHNSIPGVATYKDGAIDGDYGPLTAQATFRAKYWLGYPEKAVDRSFGQTIYELLTGTLKLNADNLSRRKQRLDAVTTETVGQKALAAAIPEIGNTESPPQNNLNKYGSWYGMNGVPWCAIFCSWCFGHTGNPRFRYSYVPTVHEDASVARNSLVIARTVRPGDLALFSWSGQRDAHIEFFEHWINTQTFSSVGGNTGSSSFNNGGAVERNVRYVSNVDVFVRAT